MKEVLCIFKIAALSFKDNSTIEFTNNTARIAGGTVASKQYCSISFLKIIPLRNSLIIMLDSVEVPYALILKALYLLKATLLQNLIITQLIYYMKDLVALYTLILPHLSLYSF